MLTGLLLMALVAQPADVSAPASSSGVSAKNEVVSTAMEAAIANKARVKTAPSFKNEPDYVRPDDARMKGEFGEVVLFGIVGEDGKVREPKIKVSSRSASIDAAALAAVPAMLFEPARNADGTALSLAINIALEFSQIDFHGSRSIAQYRCDQFVRDYDWWYRTWPADIQDRIYKTLRGYIALADMRSGKGLGATDFQSEWKAAIEACRASPDKLMLDMLKPHGGFIRSMVKKG